MMRAPSSHPQALRALTARIGRLLILRCSVRWATLWLFLWGVVVLALRIAGARNPVLLLAGSLGFIPIAIIAAWRERRRRAPFQDVRAAYDAYNRCGGLVMAEEVADMSSWMARLPAPAAPRLRWRGWRSLGLLAVSITFVVVAMWLPIRLSDLSGRAPLEIGKLAGELRAEIETLKQEKIIEPTKAEDLEKQLARLEEKALASDPEKTWEALDHMKESNSDLAQQAEAEAMSKLTTLAEAETLAKAVELALGSGLGSDAANQATRDVASLLKAAGKEDGLLKSDLPADLLSNANGLSKEDMARLLQAIQSNKSGLGTTMTNLAYLKLIDPKQLSQCRSAGECANPDALAAFLCQCTNGTASFLPVATSYGRGGIDRGRGDAPMTWKDESSDQGVKFKEHVLPPSGQLADSQVVGVSRAAPAPSGDDVTAGHGALAGAPGSGGSAWSQEILPRHKNAVRQFFKRDEPSP